MSCPGDVPDLRKALFTSPRANVYDKVEINGKSLSSKYQINLETDIALKNTQKEGHEKRMKQFRKRARYLHEDAWMYQSLNELIGLK